MLVKLKISIALLLFLLIPAQLSADVVSTFDDSLEGWVGVDVMHSAVGGSSGGFARFEDGTGVGSFLTAPDQFLGDWNQYGSLSFEHAILQLSGRIRRIGDYEVRIAGPGGSAIWLYGDPPTGLTTWRSFDVPLEAASWNVGGSWENLIDNVTEFEIRIELVDNPNLNRVDIEGIDNVRLVSNSVPEPSTCLAMSAILGFTIVRRRRNR